MRRETNRCCSSQLNIFAAPTAECGVQVYKAVRHGVSEVAVKMVKCVVRVLEPAANAAPRDVVQSHWISGIFAAMGASGWPRPRARRCSSSRDLGSQAEDSSTLQLMRKEIGIMQRISYDSHIVQFFGACTTTEPAMLVMEYMRVRAEVRHQQV